MVEASFPDELWYSNFRVTRGTFTYILHEIVDEISRQDTPMRKAVTPNRRHRLAIALYYLASTEEYRTIGNLFSVSVAFVRTCIKEVCEAIRNKMACAISCTRGDNLLNVIQGCNLGWRFSMCGGAIDGIHIPILAPNESHADYVNRKGYRSIIMQAVVDHNHPYGDVVIGWPGSVHDARVLSNSKTFEKGNNNTLFPQNVEEEISGQKITQL
ncbi:putative nuclease HARBI1 [Montipora foliosa]|uniref:putative nuclease HARBI1 n=1 Tax=Montipora foliosa TaxID=591990 RepID=UPI0035F1B352